jgi:hypothetical protein
MEKKFYQKKGFKVAMALFGGFFVIGLIATAVNESINPDSLNDFETQPPYETQTADESQPPLETDIETPTELTTAEMVTSVAESVFGADNVSRARYTEETSHIVIEAFEDNAYYRGMLLSVHRVLEQIQDVDFLTIDIRIRAGFIDVYGNSREDTALQASYTKETLDKINWSNFSRDNLPELADLWRVHQAFN